MERADLTLSAVIRQVRDEREETQEDVAHEAGLTTGSYARIERGVANPAWTTVRRLAQALEVSLVELAELVEAEEH